MRLWLWAGRSSPCQDIFTDGDVKGVLRVLNLQMPCQATLSTDSGLRMLLSGTQTHMGLAHAQKNRCI